MKRFFPVFESILISAIFVSLVQPALGAEPEPEPKPVVIEQDLVLPTMLIGDGAGTPVCVDDETGLLMAGCDAAVGPQGPPGPQGEPGNLALANQVCPIDYYLYGFDGDGSVLCAPVTGACANHIVDAREECDEGGVNTASCDSDCSFPVCGDGLLNTAAGETCDDGNIIDGDGCSFECSAECTVGNQGETRPCFESNAEGSCEGLETCDPTDPLGWIGCTAPVPIAELCDGQDNNCNGETDEIFPTLGNSCGVGACTGGSILCLANGAGTFCDTDYLAVEEICNGIDDDCDGEYDEGNPGGGGACSTGQLGVCEASTISCTGGALSCEQTIFPVAEVCDGLDNDCDGSVDEGNPGGGGACLTGQLGVCATGTNSCTGGALICEQMVQPAEEVCDGLDNDCDGSEDEGNPGGGGACSTGQLGVCEASTISCTGGALSCEQTIFPVAEVCDGLDNDCDGSADEGNPGGGGACSTGQLGVCAAGTNRCTGGALICEQNVQPVAEVCDGLDNDCDGSADEGNPGGGGACSTGQLGVCATGTTSCTGGALICEQMVQPAEEVCDGLDNDCDGETDEGC